MKKKIILVIILVSIFSGIGFFFFNHFKEQCSINVEEKIVRGNSLSPLIESGQTVKILFGYYNCHKIKRGDVIAYQYTGDPRPLIKIVKGLPDDKFYLKRSVNGWHILINNKILKNSQDEPYLLDKKGYKMLSLYIKDYKEKIPENTYLILGNLISGSLDSTAFGLIDKTDILAKVEL